MADNAYLKRLSAALHDLDADLNGESPRPSAAQHRRHWDPGAFRLLLGSGVNHNINNLGQDGTARSC